LKEEFWALKEMEEWGRGERLRDETRLEVAKGRILRSVPGEGYLGIFVG